MVFFISKSFFYINFKFFYLVCIAVLFAAFATTSAWAAESIQPLEKIARDTERDYYLNAEEAKDYGLVDEVISKRP